MKEFASSNPSYVEVAKQTQRGNEIHILQALYKKGGSSTMKKISKLLVLCFVLVLFSNTVGYANQLVISYEQSFTSLDPHKSAERSLLVFSKNVYDSLISLSPDGSFAPGLATSWEVIDDLTWRFALREGVVFHNGAPFTAEDVVYTFERFLTEGKSSPLYPMVQVIDKVEAVDGDVVISTKEPHGPLLATLTMIFIVPRDVDVTNKPVGTGPFAFVSWQPGDELVLAANEQYWGGSPQVDRVVFREIPELSTRLAALERGEIHIAFGVPAEDAARLDARPDVFTINADSFRIRWLWINSQDGPLSDVRVRQAVRYAIDREAIVEFIMFGSGKPLDSVVAPGVVGYRSMGLWPYNPEKAVELLGAAGYPDGFELALDFSESDPKQLEIAQTIASMLEEVGIQVELRRKDRAVWLEDLLKLNWNLNLFSNASLTGDADAQLRRLYHSSAKRMGYSNAVLDDLLTKSAVVADPQARREILDQIVELMWEDSVSDWLFVHQESLALRDNVKGFVFPPNGMFSLHGVSVE